MVLLDFGDANNGTGTFHAALIVPTQNRDISFGTHVRSEVASETLTLARNHVIVRMRGVLGNRAEHDGAWVRIYCLA
jgi:hypothetical protein